MIVSNSFKNCGLISLYESFLNAVHDFIHHDEAYLPWIVVGHTMDQRTRSEEDWASVSILQVDTDLETAGDLFERKPKGTVAGGTLSALNSTSCPYFSLFVSDKLLQTLESGYLCGIQALLPLITSACHLGAVIYWPAESCSSRVWTGGIIIMILPASWSHCKESLRSHRKGAENARCIFWMDFFSAWRI